MKQIIKWNDWHAIIMLIASILSIYLGRLDILFGISFLSFITYLWLCGTEVKEFKPIGGYCNWITFARLILIGLFCLFVTADANKFIWLGTLVFAAILDGLDGYLARKYDQSSVFGEYFDVEVDALFVLSISFYFYHFTEIGIWILVPAFLRYIYKIARMLAVKNDFRESKSKLSTYIAGYYFTVLLLSMVLFNELRMYILMSGAILVSISFLISYYEFFVHRSVNKPLEH